MKALSVTELTHNIKKQLETSFSSVYVQGEISNIKLQSSGHYYFTLKDASSQISSVLFKGQTRNLSRAPKEGDKVVVFGEITVYAPRGNYQLIVKSIDFLGVGNLLMQLHELKAKLQAKGLFASERKKALPKHPKTIGVVTSPTGAVIQDILNVLSRRSKGFHLILNPVKVQGEGSAQEIAKAIDDFNKHKLCDVMIVGRGGGSLEDLWAFNEEIVVEAIARSQIPIISAVGHETDVSLSDFAADVRAPTPSAAAEICVAEKNQQIAFLSNAQKQLLSIASSKISFAKKQLLAAKRHPFIASNYHILSQKIQDVDTCKEKLDLLTTNLIAKKKLELSAKKKQSIALSPYAIIHSYREKSNFFKKSIDHSIQSLVFNKKSLLEHTGKYEVFDKISSLYVQSKVENLQKLSSHLKALNPKNLLNKGYCILFSEKKDSVILNTQDVKLDQKIHILMSDGELLAKVEGKQ